MTKRSKMMLTLTGALALAGCGGGKGNGQAQNNADALRNAADQSTPAAAEVLRNEADNVSRGNTSLAPADPNSPTQQAMNKAGNVAAKQ